MRNQYKRVAVVYDRVNKWGGAERLLLSIRKVYPNSVLFTSLYDPGRALWASEFSDVRTSFLNRFPFLRSRHEFVFFLMPLVFESFDFSDFDLVVSVTSEASKGVITGVDTKHVCICLTPTRYLWSGYFDYFDSKIKRFFFNPIVKYMKWWDSAASYRADLMIGISSEVVQRIKKYYGRNAELLYPPIEKFKAQSVKFKVDGLVIRDFKDYYLCVGRLVKYKKHEILIEAFNEMGKKLLIVGEGREEKKLKKMAKNNILFTKNISDEQLVFLYKNCRGLICPQEEDFGLVMAEAQSLGMPVISFARGGAADIVVHGKTGVLFEKQTKESIINAIEYFEKQKFDRNEIIKNTKRFEFDNFKKRLLELIENA